MLRVSAESDVPPNMTESDGPNLESASSGGGERFLRSGDARSASRGEKAPLPEMDSVVQKTRATSAVLSGLFRILTGRDVCPFAERQAQNCVYARLRNEPGSGIRTRGQETRKNVEKNAA